MHNYFVNSDGRTICRFYYELSAREAARERREISRTRVQTVANGSIILRIVHSLTMYAERPLPKAPHLRQKCLTQEKVYAASI